MKARTARVGVFVDADNIFISTKKSYGMSARINYRALLQYALAIGDVVMATAYTSRPTWNNRPSAFEMYVKRSGFQVSPVCRRRLPDGREKSSADVTLTWDVAMALAKNEVDFVLLVSGDGDFAPICRSAKSMGVTVEVLGSPKSTAPELIVDAFQFMGIADVDGLLCLGTQKAA